MESIPAGGRYKRFAAGALILNVVIVLGGALVRATKSGAGCGAHWPLCDGEVIPGLKSYHQSIEFSHRLLVGVGIIVVLSLWAGIRKNYPRTAQVRKAAAFSMFFTFTESLIGAALVLFKWEGTDQSIQRIFAVSSHLINTLLLLASLFLVYWGCSHEEELDFRGNPKVFAANLWSMLITVVIGISGAITALGDTLFPAASRAEIARSVSQNSPLLTKIRVVHPAIALTGLAVIALLCWKVTQLTQSESVANWAWLTVLAGVVQTTIGMLNLFMLVPLYLQLIHLLVADIFWFSLLGLTARSLTRRFVGNAVISRDALPLTTAGNLL